MVQALLPKKMFEMMSIVKLQLLRLWAGYQLDKVQRGEQPDDFKAMPSIGKGVEEIRI